MKAVGDDVFQQRRAMLAAIAAIALISFVLGAASGGSAGEPAANPRPAPRQPAAKAATCPPPLPGVVRSGPEGAKAVALSFDDGPSAQTPAILRALRRHHAKATFFVLGRELPGRVGILRRILRQGHELGNHSTSHDALPSRADIAATSDLIQLFTGRRPCLFRPPMGRTSDRLLARVRRLGMTTVTWNVDPADWASQDATGIRERVLAATAPGSIVIMHDGGGDRAGTAHAVSAVIDGLHDRGDRLVTVSQLLAEAGN